mgnify:CR=1 FL=1
MKAHQVRREKIMMRKMILDFLHSDRVHHKTNMVAAFWGVFIWKEFKAAPKGVNPMLALMFLLYIVGLAMIIAARLA